jgi:hypothetical protein
VGEASLGFLGGAAKESQSGKLGKNDFLAKWKYTLKCEVGGLDKDQLYESWQALGFLLHDRVVTRWYEIEPPFCLL